MKKSPPNLEKMRNFQNRLEFSSLNDCVLIMKIDLQLPTTFHVNHNELMQKFDPKQFRKNLS